MVTTTDAVEVLPGSELDRLLAEANGATIVLVRDGRRSITTSDGTVLSSNTGNSAQTSC